MGNALKQFLKPQTQEIDDDVLEACLKMTLPLEPDRMMPREDRRPFSKSRSEESSFFAFLSGPFHNNY